MTIDLETSLDPVRVAHVAAFGRTDDMHAIVRVLLGLDASSLLRERMVEAASAMNWQPPKALWGPSRGLLS